MYKTTGISQIRNVSDTEFEIDYEYESKVVATLFLKVDPDADAHFKRLVNAKVFPSIFKILGQRPTLSNSRYSNSWEFNCF